MFSSTKVLIIIICIAEAKHYYDPDEAPLVKVNGMSLQAKPDVLSEVDYVAEYQYMEGDEVDVRCYTIDTARESIRMEYAVADTFSDNFNTTSLPLGGAWGFITTLYSGHNNSYITCIEEESGIKVMVKFIMPTELPLVSITINGVAIRPQKKKRRVKVNTYLVQYQAQTNSNQMTVVCGVDQENFQLVVMDTFVSNQTDYKKTEIITSKQTKMSFKPMSRSNQLICSADHITGGTAEEVIISYHSSPHYVFPLELFPINGPVMQFYSIKDVYYKFVFYFYEFEAGDILDLNCTLRRHSWQGFFCNWLQSDDTDTCKEYDCSLYKQLNLTLEHNNTKYSFYGMLRSGRTGNTNYSIGAEVRVIFRLISNKTKSWKSLYQNSKGRIVVASPSEATNLDHTTTIIVSVVSTVGGALVLCGLAYLILRLRRRNYERQLRLRIAANTAPQFYLNLILRDDCDREIAEIDQHIYEEIGPPIYDVVDNRDCEEIDEPDYAEIDIPENNGAVCEESVSPVSEEIQGPMHENIEAPVRGETNTPVHEKIDAPVHVDMEASVYEPMHRSVKWPREMDKMYTGRKIKKRSDKEDDAYAAKTKNRNLKIS